MATHQSRDEPSFGALLRRHRLMGHLTQAALAARASLSQRGIADLERGLRQTPRADTVARLADGLGLTGHARSAFEASAARFAQTTRNPPPSNLPADGASFIGRERQLRQIRTALSVHGARLVSLTGPGGAGKTRIALRAADELLAQFPDGVFVVWLSEVNDAELVPAALAQALGLPERSDRPILRSVADFLRRKQLLLVIDNFEHLMPAAAAVVSQLLKSAANLNMLVTSRVRLNLSGEHVIQVPPMALPDQTAGTTAQALTQFESVRLFLDRARASQPDLELTDSNAWRIAEICRRLDGLPLSLELAAARLRVLSLESLQALLEQRLPLLTGGPRDTPARQQTMRNAVAWSYDLLGPGEQLLFRRLAVFHGGGLGAIERVCGEASATDGSTSIVIAPLGIDLLDGLAALVDNSLLLRNETPDGQPWFVMLEIIREYALERLLESAEAEAIRRRHALRCVELAESAGPTLTGRRQSVWIPVLERESANLRAALIWCQQRGYAEPAFRLAVSLWWFWVISGRAIEGRDRLTNLLARFPPRTHPARYALVRARAAQAAGNLCGFQADYPSARSFHEEAAQAFRQQGDEGSLHGALQALGWVASRQGEHAAALGYLQEALELVRKRGDPAATGAALFNLAYVKHELRDYAAAQELLEQSLALKADLGRSASMGLIHVMLGLVALDRGDTRRARELCELGLRLGRAAGDHRGIGVALVDSRQSQCRRATMSPRATRSRRM